MLRNKKHNFLISLLLLAVFFLPITISALHSFSNHKHEICNANHENHIHKKDIDCELHLLKQNNAFLNDYNFTLPFDKIVYGKDNLYKNFLKNHQQLSFSLRGPPFISFS